MISPKTLAWFGAVGTLCDALGGVYLTYDLLGGGAGPLGLGMRAATYGMIFGLGYGLAFGPFFGTVACFGLGGILALEFWRVAYHQRKYHSSPLYHIPSLGAARGLLLGLAAVHRFGWRFGLIFGVLNAIFLYAVYWMRFAPGYDYTVSPRPRLNFHAYKAAFMRSAAVGLSGALAAYAQTHQLHSLGLGLTIGITVGLISVVVGLVSPSVEWWIEHLPDRHLAVIGFVLIAFGLLFQSVQYLVVILDLR